MSMPAAPCPVVVLNWNGWDDTFACLTALRAVPDRFEPWLIDNASAVDRSAEASACCPGLRLHRWQDNHGWAGGYNRALEKVAAEGHRHAYLLNNDCRVTPGFLTEVLRLAAQDPSAAAVGSRIAYADDPRFLRFDAGALYEPGERPLAEGPEVSRCRTVNGAGMLLRLDAFEQIGGFDERFFCYHEETDWCVRAGKRGWSILASGRSLVFHRCEGSNVGDNSLYYRSRNRFLVIECTNRGDAGIRACLILELLSLGDRERQAGHTARWRAISDALADGVNGRFGRRAASVPSDAEAYSTWTRAVQDAQADIARGPASTSVAARMRYGRLPEDDRARATVLLAEHDPEGAARARLARLEGR